jgi:hypothetical protein
MGRQRGEAIVPKLTGQQIKTLAKEIVRSNPGGIRYTQLTREIHEANPETPVNTIHGSIWNLDALFPNEITKPSRGLYTPADVAETAGAEEASESTIEVTPQGKKVTESDFYEPFAEWLKNDLDEVTDVASLGGAGLKAKWGTPDVVGAYKPLASNLIKFPLEIVSAEIKIDRTAPVVAFGQAVAYRLFSAKSYIAMPTTLTQEDQSRLEALCMLFGVGLVLFDLDPINPNFSIRVRAQRFSPDMFYVNEFADRLKTHNPTVFEHIFG